jgi:LacI family transcriptional regulator
VGIGKDGGRRATIRDVARLAGVSDMTVSRVVNSPRSVRSGTREKVERAVAELAYEPNAMARGMRTNVTSTVGFLLPDITNATNASIAQAASQVLANENYRMLLFATDYNAKAESEFLSKIPNSVVDGIIIAMSDETDRTIHKQLSSLRIPYVVLDRDLPFASDSIKSEHELAMTDALGQLYQLGHRRIGLVMSPSTVRPGRARIEAFHKFMRERNLPENAGLVRSVRQTVEDGRDATAALLNEIQRPTAIIVGSNQATFGAIQAIQAANLRIPDDISLIGADDKVFTELLTPPLSVIWRDMAEVGRAAAKLLLARLGGDTSPPRSITIGSELILRASCGPPAAAT